MDKSGLSGIHHRIRSAKVITDNSKRKDHYMIWIESLKEVWPQLSASSSEISLKLENLIVSGLMGAVLFIQETEFQLLGLTSVCSNRLQLCQRLNNVYKYNITLLVTVGLVKFWISVINEEPEEILEDRIKDVKRRLGECTLLSAGYPHLMLCRFDCQKLREKVIQLDPHSYISMLRTSYSKDDADNNLLVPSSYTTSLMCDLEGTDDFLFHWKNDKNNDKIVNLFINMRERLEKQYGFNTEYSLSYNELMGYLNSTQKNDAGRLMNELCKTQRNERVRPWWLDLILCDTSTYQPTEQVEYDQGSSEEKYSSEPSSKSIKEHSSDRFSRDDSVNTKETIIYYNKLRPLFYVIPNDKICYYFKMKKELLPQISLVEGTNMPKDKWCHARRYDYLPLDNVWQFRSIVIKMICKVSLSTSCRGSFRDLYEAQDAYEKEPIAAKIYRCVDNRRMWRYTADIRCQSIGSYYGDLFTKKYGDKYKMVVGIADAFFVQVFEDSKCRKVIDFFNTEARIPSHIKFQRFTNNSSFVNPKTNSELATAFGHFTFLESEHRLVVVGFKGWSYIRKDGAEGLLLTDPAIHAPMWEWNDFVGGNTNGGDEGIHIFWNKQHAKCNEICKRLGLERPRNR